MPPPSLSIQPAYHFYHPMRNIFHTHKKSEKGPKKRKRAIRFLLPRQYVLKEKARELNKPLKNKANGQKRSAYMPRLQKTIEKQGKQRYA
jgi:hypothetical protein